jgi:hypothetical protein
VALLLASIVFSAAAFLVLDFVRTAVIRRRSKSSFSASPCRIPDAQRHHAFKPNCADTHVWGRLSYPFFTNNLAMRDEKVRDVPLTVPEPRILMLGDSFTEGIAPWSETYVGRIATHFPQYDFLNGGVVSYSPSNYLNVARGVLGRGVEIDEVIVFIDISDVQDEAAFYRDVNDSGAVAGPERPSWSYTWYDKWCTLLENHLLLTRDLLQLFERWMIGKGHYGWVTEQSDVFVMDRAAWTYRQVDEAAPWPNGFAPLGVEGGIAKEKARMDRLSQELKQRNIPLSVVVYPYPAQVAHDTADSRQVRIWREWCQDRCKRFVSVFPAFFAAKAQCPSERPGCWYLDYFIFGDYHYTAAGNALVADAVIQSLTEAPPAKRHEEN